jgi:Spy/CpxP family protein refolding chaperone
MTMAKSPQLVLLSLGLILAIAAAGEAQTRRPIEWSNPDLGLTDEQLAKIQEIRIAFQQEILPLRMNWQKIQLSLDTLMRKDADQSQIDARIEALSEVELELEKKYLDHRAQIRELLTQEQRVIFDRFGGLGLGWGWGTNPRWGMRFGMGRSFGSSRGLGMGRGFRSAWSPGMGLGFGRGLGRGMGRGYFCPWFRWR